MKEFSNVFDERGEHRICSDSAEPEKQRMQFNVYFLGIGGIGMSALARYFLHEGRRVAGYDRVVLLPIYPAREEPIPGVESEMIGRLLTVPWTICDRAELAEKVAAMDTDVVVSFGAGNIDACCGALAEKLREKA